MEIFFGHILGKMSIPSWQSNQRPMVLRTACGCLIGYHVNSKVVIMVTWRPKISYRTAMPYVNIIINPAVSLILF